MYRSAFSSLLLISLLFTSTLSAQHHLNHLIPINTATHTAQQSGDWFDTSTWAEGNIPSDAAIVHIPSGIAVTYQGQSTAHIFAIRVDGFFSCTQPNANDTTTLIFDTFVGTMSSILQFQAGAATDGTIAISIQPFDIEAHKAGTSGYSQVWNSAAIAHFSDRATHYQVTYDIGPDDRFKTYALALAGNTSVTETSRVAVDDLAGVLGRTAWDATQLSIGLITMGQIEVIGQEKSTMGKLSADALKNATSISLESAPTGWEVGDSILITLGGNKNATANATELAAIASISGNTITIANALKKNHRGRAADDLHCYVGNLDRNILFQSTQKDATLRGHFMVMHNPTNVQIKNAAFKDMGRTNKNKLTDDRIWSNWVEPVVANTYVSALGQECSQLVAPPSADISNHRGRYSIHLHELGATYGTNRAEVTGNVVWGNPGWGISHHSSHANVSENVVYEVLGSGIVSEAGDETGFWDNNLVVQISNGHKADVYEASLFYDDYLFSGQGLGMKGRGVVCRGNVVADANIGVGIVNFNAAINSTARMDAAALANVRPGFEFDQFPLSQNAYAAEGDGILPLEVALIFENTTVINCNYGLSSIERDMGVNHESRSVFHNFKVWGASTGVRITYQNDYSFRDLFISGRNDNAIGLYMWKHSHNHSFERIKLVDLLEGITASKLVESNTQPPKTRNNGFTPWLFIDLETENVTNLYGIHLDDETSSTAYTEHPDNPIHLSASDLSLTRPITFTLNDQADLEIDLGSSPVDLQFKVDGVVTDRIGAYEFGIEQASSMQNLRNDYPQRIYEFASQTKLEEYLSANGVYLHPDDNSLYFIINEYVPDRITYEYKAFPIRIKILNPPSGGVYASPLSEAAINFEPQNELLSRFATATQSSTSTNESFNGDLIDVSASKAIDGNSNARINARYYQQGLDPIGSSAITETELEPWWEMDLGEEKIIEYLNIWNTVDLQGTAMETPSNHFKDFYVLIDDQPFGAIDLTAARAQANYEYYKDAAITRVFSLNALNVKGRYIRIQAVGTTKMGLAEVDLIGRNISVNADCNGDVGGLAYLDECGNCVGGNTGLTPCALDANYEWGGTANTMTLTSSVLPVELVLFDGKLIGDQTRLDWVAASEYNVLGYELQRSKDGINWEYLDFIRANNRPDHYRRWDTDPYLGFTYYRLMIMDYDSRYEYSHTIAVQRKGSAVSKLFPNPNAGNFQIILEQSTNVSSTLQVVNILGKVLYQQSLPAGYSSSKTLAFDLSNLPPGTYYLQSHNEGKPWSVPFVLVKE